MHVRTRQDTSRFTVDELWPKFVCRLLWTKQVFRKYAVPSDTVACACRSTMLIQLCLHRITCCLITVTQRWQSGDLLAATSLISSWLVRKQSAVTFSLLWVCVVIQPVQQKILSYQDIISPNQPAAQRTLSSQSVILGISAKRSTYLPIGELPICLLFK